jgi:hypothetical protein
MKRLLERDPLTGIETWFHKDGEGFKLEAMQDVSAIVDLNKALQNAEINKGQNNEFWHAASVPMIILQQWANEAGLAMNDKAFGEVVKKKLNDPDNRFMRTGLFKI